MILRELQEKDAPLMLEWMHDEDVVQNLKNNFAEKTIDDCKNFILLSQNMEKNIHMAIVDEEDVYMGTVSLKNIDRDKCCAEFAITMRKCAMGRGYAQYGMREILRRGFFDLGFKEIYWYVSKENLRAIKFYEKMHFKRILNMDLLEQGIHDDSMVWYNETSEDFSKKDY